MLRWVHGTVSGMWGDDSPHSGPQLDSCVQKRAHGCLEYSSLQCTMYCGPAVFSPCCLQPCVGVRQDETRDLRTFLQCQTWSNISLSNKVLNTKL